MMLTPVSMPTRDEAQLMLGMSDEERAQFLALCGRVQVIRNIGDGR